VVAVVVVVQSDWRLAVSNWRKTKDLTRRNGGTEERRKWGLLLLLLLLPGAFVAVAVAVAL
jgi:hypothetical protein